MKKNEVIKELCRICTGIADQRNDHSLPHDCFCGDYDNDDTFQFSQWYLNFIDEAVNEKIEREKVTGTIGIK